MNVGGPVGACASVAVGVTAATLMAINLDPSGDDGPSFAGGNGWPLHWRTWSDLGPPFVSWHPLALAVDIVVGAVLLAAVHVGVHALGRRWARRREG